MNTQEFVKNFDSHNISSLVTRFFDEIMVLYNLVGSRQDIDICTDDGTSVASFILMMDSAEQASELYANLNGTVFSVYENCFEVSMQMESDSSVKAIISKVE